MMANWQQVTAYPDLAAMPEEKPIAAEAGNHKICLLRRGEALFAFAASCPHAGVPLCMGYTDSRGHLVCPKHGYRFELSRGYNSSGEGYKLKTFPVEIREEGIFVLLS